MACPVALYVTVPGVWALARTAGRGQPRHQMKTHPDAIRDAGEVRSARVPRQTGSPCWE